MAEQRITFAQSVPENYERYLGPMFFDPYAQDLAARLQVKDGIRVLEVACGTGIVTRRLRERMPTGSKLVATDLSEPMLAFARQKFGPDFDVEWQQADAVALPFADGSFDAVVCQFGLMFMPDKAAAVREAHRVLTPGGQFLCNVWDSLANNDFAQVAHTTAISFFESDPPRFYETPFGFHDVKMLQALLTDAGFQNVTVRPVDLPCVSPSASDAAKGLVGGTPLTIQITERNGDQEAITAAVADAVRTRFGNDPARSRMRALICAGTR